MELQKIRRIVLVGHENEGSEHLFRAVTGAYPHAEYMLVVGQGLYHGKSFLASVLKLLREASWLFVFVRFLELLRFKLTGRTMEGHARKHGMRVMHTRNINSQESLRLISEFQPDLLVSLFTMQIYKKDVLAIPKYGAITSHPSILPHYRGLEVFFWVLANDENETGVSVFFLSERIDAGAVIGQERVPITPQTSVASLYRTITEVGGRLLVAAIADIDAGTTRTYPQEGQGSYYSMPDRASVRRFLRLGRKFF
jgi:folate-dependent phosphoribosylglycinamide formyltransferase PurN